VDWKPAVNLTPAQLAAGLFYFHSCLRVRIDQVAGETVLANQDGDREQENISYFEVPAIPKLVIGPLERKVWIRNGDPTHARSFLIGSRLTVPKNGATDWSVDVNHGAPEVTLAPNESRQIPVEIDTGSAVPVAGQRYSVDIFALSHRFLGRVLGPKTGHNEFAQAGGARIEGVVVAPTHVSCRASVDADGRIVVAGQLKSRVEIKNRGVVRSERTQVRAS
jgi:hypothetical protein